jgi:outer membrane protein OmpA-like peptidoglycan-associated protein
VSVKLGKCINYAGCGVAYRNELVTAQASAFVCPECGKPLKGRSTARINVPLALAVLSGFLFLSGAGWMLLGNRTVPPRRDRAEQEEPTSTPEPTVSTPVPTPEYSPPPAAPTPTSTPQPFAAATAPPAIDDRTAPTPYPTAPTPTPYVPIIAEPTYEPPPVADSNEREEVRREVLKRIDAMPSLTAEVKNKLYRNVDKARSMVKMFSVRFDSGQTALNAGEEAKLRQSARSADFQRLLSDPATVFVILGYADTRGDEKRNLQLSISRAQTTQETLREKCGVYNVMHNIGMGGSTLLDASRRDKNRVAEVWAVTP